MILYKTIILFLLISLLSVEAAQKKSSSLRSRDLQVSFNCRLVEVAAEFRTGTKYEHTCEGQDEDGEYMFLYHIDDNFEKIMDQLDELGLNIEQNSGRYKITMTNVVVSEAAASVTTTPETQVTIEDNGLEESRRHLGTVTGTRTLVIFRVTQGPNVVSYSAAEIAESFFGDGEDSFKGRYKACSSGKLNFEIGSIEAHFVNGVAEMSITEPVNGADTYAMQNIVWQQIRSTYGYNRRTFDHVVIALPGGTTIAGQAGWLAYAEVDAAVSVYNDNNIMYLSNQVHETGHNLGMSHSGDGNVAYGDQSGAMGYGYAEIGGPRMCFNAPKTWQFGWFDDKSLEADPSSGAITVNLDSPLDYNNVPDQEIVVMKIGTLYAIYNKRKGVNSGTREYGDMVTISDMPNEGENSWHEAALAAGATHTFSYGGGTAVIEVCELKNEGGVDKAKVSVYMQSHGSSCGNAVRGSQVLPPTPQPTREATNRPTPSPDDTAGTGGEAPPVQFCFSGSTTVQVKDKGQVTMGELELGDEVLVSTKNQIYEEVYSFGHLSDSNFGDYLRLGPSQLELSKSHMVYVQEKGAVPASMVQVGDVLEGGVEVTSVDAVTSKGVYAPFTPSGRIVVNNVLASTYIAFQDSPALKVGSLDSPVSYQWMSHTIMLPHRLNCYYFGKCHETYNAEGVTSSLARPLELYQWFLVQSDFLQSLITVLVLLPLSILFMSVEGTYNVALLISLAVVLATRYTTRSTVAAGKKL